MTLSFRLFKNLLSVLFVAVSIGAEQASATPVTPLRSSAFSLDYSKSDEAELCDSNDMRYRVFRAFSKPFSFFVEFSQDPRVEPVVKEGYAHVQEAGGTLQQRPVSFDMFELMAEPFGQASKPRTAWASAFERVFVGKITIYDETGTWVASFDGQCNAAVVEYK